MIHEKPWIPVSWQRIHIRTDFLENHKFIYNFVKKTYDFGCTKKCPVNEFLYINSYMDLNSHMWIELNSYIDSYMKTFFMNSSMNPYMNERIWILKIWIHIRIHVRINTIRRSGPSKYGDQGVPDPNDDVDFGFGAAAAASHWVSEAGCCEQRRAAAPSEWDGQRRVSVPRRLRLAAASDGGPLRVTTVTARGRLRQAAAGDGEPLRVTRAAASAYRDGPRRVTDE